MSTIKNTLLALICCSVLSVRAEHWLPDSPLSAIYEQLLLGNQTQAWDQLKAQVQRSQWPGFDEQWLPLFGLLMDQSACGRELSTTPLSNITLSLVRHVSFGRSWYQMKLATEQANAQQVALYGKNGRMIIQGDLRNEGEQGYAELESLTQPQPFSAGVYRLEITDSSRLVITELMLPTTFTEDWVTLSWQQGRQLAELHIPLALSAHCPTSSAQWQVLDDQYRLLHRHSILIDKVDLQNVGKWPQNARTSLVLSQYHFQSGIRVQIQQRYSVPQ